MRQRAARSNRGMSLANVLDGGAQVFLVGHDAGAGALHRIGRRFPDLSDVLPLMHVGQHAVGRHAVAGGDLADARIELLAC